ncbi:MAG: M4 family metallopeptidase [Polyangiaceae bacterium]|nr:M4 family metallopeptidase [Polyangiaceae bacterium]
MSVIIAAAACQGTGDVGDEVLDKTGGTIQAYLDALPSARVVGVDEGGVPSFLTGILGSVEIKSDPRDVDLGEALEAIAPVFRASPEGLVLKRAQSDNIGDQHFRFKQVKNGRDVIGGEIVIHVRDGIIYAANGSARDDLDVAAMPKIDVPAAIAAALADSDFVLGAKAADAAPLAYHLAGDRMSLVYRVEVTGVRADQTPVRDTVLVNAVDGAIVDRMAHIHTAKDRKVYNLNHGTSLPGTLARSEGGAATGETTVDTNYNWLGAVYDCYYNLFGRDSLNGSGGTLISSVHYSTNYVNAYWNGTQMVYGDGDGVTASNLAHSMDVTGHELTHGVTEYESNLTYSGESGGLNESMSDIFGNVCEWYRDGQVVSNNTWLVGDDVWTPGTPGDALRYMHDPALDGDSLDYWTSGAGGVDVHYSSGISNLAFYLLSQGGTHPRGKSSINVTGIGIAKAAQIFYRANRDILTASSNFAAAKTATEQAAAQLGYTAAEQAAVTAAWNAVGVGVPPPPPTALTNGVPVTGISDSSGGQKFYSLAVPSGATGLSFTISGGTGDADLYVRFGASPDLSTYDCRPYLGGNAETCTISNIQTGTYYVMLNAYSAYSGVSLTGSYTGGGGGGSGHLVINEVEYDEVGTDSAEFVEIYNGTGAAVSLANYSLQFVNGGNNAVYRNVSLSSAGTLAAGQYLVVGSSTVTPAAGALKINFSSANDNIQNGAPDGVALVNGSTLVDAVSYEGSITAAVLSGPGTKSLVEGTAMPSSRADSNTATKSLGRYPNGTDTDNATSDWALRTTVTPGAAN